VTKLLPYKAFVDQRMDDPAFLVREFYAEPPIATLASMQVTDADGSHAVPVLTIFTDFQCPSCACFAQKWQHELRPRWTGPLQIDLRHYPLDEACNETMTSSLHPQACQAGYAAEAARLQGGDEAFWDMHDALFAREDRVDGEAYESLATIIGLDGERLSDDMNSQTVRRIVARDVRLATELGVHGTPTVFLNGRQVPGFCLRNPAFWEAISADLQQRTAESEAAPPRIAMEKASARGHSIGSDTVDR
jgi:predicted DsbA family dithiol-disulfide isomerase